MRRSARNQNIIVHWSTEQAVAAHAKENWNTSVVVQDLTFIVKVAPFESIIFIVATAAIT